MLAKVAIDPEHYSGVIMGAMAFEITGVSMVFQLFVQANIKEIIKAPRHLPLRGESASGRWIPLTKGRNLKQHASTKSW